MSGITKYRPTDIKPSYIDFTHPVVKHHDTVHVSLLPLPEDQVFHSLDLSLNYRSLTHPAHLCCWAQGPVLGTLIGICSATRQQGPQLAAPKAVIKSLLWVLWAGACLPESCLSPGLPSPPLHSLLHSVMASLQGPLRSSALLPLFVTLSQALLLLQVFLTQHKCPKGPRRLLVWEGQVT